MVQGIAEAGCAGHEAIARVGTFQAGRKVGDGHGGAVKWRGQCRAQPLLAHQGLLAHGLGQKGLAMPGAAGALSIVAMTADAMAGLCERYNVIVKTHPLSAEAPADAGAMEQLQAGLPSPDTFARIGLQLPDEFVSSLQFTPGVDAAGRPVIRVTSEAPVTDPLLTFLVEVDWGQGRLVREYSALLDPPGMDVPAAAVTAPIVSAPVAKPAPAAKPPVAVETPAPAPAAKPARMTPESRSSTAPART